MKKLFACAIGVFLSLYEITAFAHCSVVLKEGKTTVAFKPGQAIDICLPAGEKLLEVTNGSKNGWLVNTGKSADNIYVKSFSDSKIPDDANVIARSSSNKRYELQLTQSLPAGLQMVIAASIILMFGLFCMCIGCGF